MKIALRTHVAAAMLLLPVSAAFMAQPATAQQRAVVAQHEVRSMSLNSSNGLTPGATLWAEVIATPGALGATVTLGQSGVRLVLKEAGAGRYVGHHVVRRADRIDPMQLMMVQVNYRGDASAARNYFYPPGFQALATGSPHAGRPVPPRAPPVAAVPVVESFAVLPAGRLAPGSELHFRLAGTPKATATVEIPGVVRGLVLRESGRGVYEGSYTVRRADNLRSFDSAVATFARGSLATTANLDLKGAIDAPRGRDGRDDRREDRRDGRDGRDDRQQSRDHQPPQVTAVAPANGEVVDERRRTRITARLADAGSGIDAGSVRLTVDGLDVTQNTEVTAEQVRYREELGSGRHSAELVVRDKAGNTTRTAWSFQVR
jgi:hypothetical protein